MSKFMYKARDSQGKLVKGSIDMDSKEEVLASLRSKGLIVTQLKAVSQNKLSFAVTSRKTVKNKLLALLARQLAIQLEAGVSLIASLQILAEQSQDKRLAQALDTIRLDISSGSSLTSAISKHKTIFPHEFIHLVEAGELAGELPTVFNQLATYYEKMDELQKKVSQAMLYPMLIGVVAVIVVFVLIYLVLPMLSNNFASLGVQLPVITQKVLDFRQFTIKYWYYIMFIIILCSIMIHIYSKTDHGRYLRARITLSLPIIGNLTKMVIFSRFCRVLSMLLNSGISMVRALRIVERLIDNRVINPALHEARLAVEKGQGLTEPLRRHSVFPAMLVQMIAVGEETGNLDKTLVHLANYYDGEVNYAVTALTKVLEPLVILVLAVVVCFIVMSVYLPMMQMMANINF